MVINAYTNPGWNDGTAPYISATNLNALSDAVAQATSALQAVPVENGGTGATTAANARTNLGITYANIGTVGVANGGTGLTTLTSGYALIGNGTSAVSLRNITNNTTATAVTASTNLITANTLYYHKGNSNIVTVGTITSGTWQGTKVGVAYGGTGLTASPSMLTNLASTTAANVLTASPRPGVTGILPVDNGGTGRNTLTANRIIAGNGASSVNMIQTKNGALYATATDGAALFGTLPVAQGGTGATSAANARSNLGITLSNIGVVYSSSTPVVTNGYIWLKPV